MRTLPPWVWLGARVRCANCAACLGAPLPQPHPRPRRPPVPAQLLEAIAPLKRGLLATPEQKQRVEALASALERANPTPKPLASPLLNGRWRLEYTTSESILGTSKPAFLRPSGPIYQFLGA